MKRSRRVTVSAAVTTGLVALAGATVAAVPALSAATSGSTADDHSADAQDAQRQELEYDRGSAPFDGTRVRAELDELDPDQVEAYQLAIGSSSPGAMLRARGLLTRDGDPTVGAYLLFGAARLSLGIVDVAVRYHARQHGVTNISRFRHGWLLLRMSVFAARKLKFL